MPTADDLILITSQEAADILGWNVRRVNRAASSGDLPVAVQAPGYRGANLFTRASILRRAELTSESVAP